MVCWFQYNWAIRIVQESVKCFKMVGMDENNKDIKSGKKSGIWKWIAGLVVIIVIGGFVWKRLSAKNNYETASIKKGEVVEELILTGEVKAKRQANLRFLSGGELNWVGVEKGERVVAGQLLARLDPNKAYQAYEQAVADLRNAQATLERVYDEVEGNDDDETFEQKEKRTTAEVARDKAYRALQIAKENLSSTQIRAPFDGVVSKLTHQYSQVNVMSTEGQIEVVDPESLYFEVSADQTEVGKIKKGQKVTVVLDALNDKEVTGNVEYVDITPKEGEAGTIYGVEVALNDKPETLLVGMSGDAKFVVKESKEALYVPFEFLSTDQDGDYLLVGNPENKVYIEKGAEGDERIEVSGEIKEGMTIYD